MTAEMPDVGERNSAGSAAAEQPQEQGASSVDTVVKNDGHTKATPLPFKQMAALSLVLLSESVCSSMLLPFVALFVTHLQHYPNTNQAGKASGILVGLFMLGQVVSSMMWGYVSDVYGRRFPIMVGLFAGGWTMFFFGLSPNIYVCCLLRFVHGFFNGNVLVAKTVIADVTDKTNAAKGFALVSIMWGLGTCVGPALGGFLYAPAENPKLKWMHVSPDSFLGRNPAFLPSVVVFAYTMVSLVLTFLTLKETNVYRKPLSSTKAVMFLVHHMPFLACLFDDNTTAAHHHHSHKPAHATDVTVGPATTTATTAATEPARSPLGSQASRQEENGNDDDVRSVRALTRSTFAAVEGCSNLSITLDNETGEAKPATPAPAPVRRTKISYIQAMRIKPIRNITLLYVLLSASDMTYSEILPLWAVAATAVGGLNYFSDQVAIIMLACSVPSVAANVCFPQLCRLLKNDYIFFWIISILIYTASTLIIPQGNKFGWYSGLCFIVGFGVLRQVGSSWAYSLIHMLTAKAAPAGCVGSIYGISQSCASLTRCIIPFLVAPLFAWSIDKPRPFPINYYLLFLFASACSFASFVLVLFVRITHSTEDDAVEVQITAAGNDHHAVTPTVGGGGSDDNDDDDDSDDGLPEAYFSLVASFCTNPIQDAYIPVAQLERVNLEEHTDLAAQRREHDGSDTALNSRGELPDTGDGSGGGHRAAAGADSHFPGSLQPRRQEEDEGVKGEEEEEEGGPTSPTGHSKTYTIRARTAELLQSLRNQQVESRRATGTAPSQSGHHFACEVDEEEDDLGQAERITVVEA